MLRNKLLAASMLTISSAVLASGGEPASDPIADFESGWAGRALDMQRSLDVYDPISTNSILGTHNTYNSEVYRDIDSYLDPQQKHSIYDQLRLGARFIELDAHWTYEIDGFDWGNDLLLCHSGIGASFGDVHVGCSLTDRNLREGIDEVKNWLNDGANAGEVIIMYIEDHTDGQHQLLFDIINNRIGHKIYKSGGCKNIPSDLTKADVLAAGKQVIWWKDGGCSGNSNVANAAFTGLGSVSRVFEDATAIRALQDFFTSSEPNRLSIADIRNAHKSGVNIVNLDDMTYNDGRNEAAIWSWDQGQPNNYGGNQDCASQWGNGRWDDTSCSNSYRHACLNTANGSWALSATAGAWTSGANACSQLGSSYEFSVPTNSKDNAALAALNPVAESDRSQRIWLNYHDRNQEGKWQGPVPAEYANLNLDYGTGIKLATGYNRNVCLDISGVNSRSNGANAQIWECGGVSETWNLLSNGKLQASWDHSKCLDVAGTNSGSNGANVGIWQCDQVTETWNLLDNGKIQARWNTGKCLDVSGTNATGNGTNVAIWDCGSVTETWVSR